MSSLDLKHCMKFPHSGWLENFNVFTNLFRFQLVALASTFTSTWPWTPYSRDSWPNLIFTPISIIWHIGPRLFKIQQECLCLQLGLRFSSSFHSTRPCPNFLEQLLKYVLNVILEMISLNNFDLDLLSEHPGSRSFHGHVYDCLHGVCSSGLSGFRTFCKQLYFPPYYFSWRYPNLNGFTILGWRFQYLDKLLLHPIQTHFRRLFICGHWEGSCNLGTSVLLLICLFRILCFNGKTFW